MILDVHNYMHYCLGMSPSDNNCPNIVNPDEMYNIWQQLSHQYKTNEFVIFDVMNEPSRLSTHQVLENTAAALKAIQEEEKDGGVNNLVLIEGNGWTGASTWGDNWYDTATSDKKSNAQVLTAENLKISGVTYENIAINVHQYYGQLTGMGEVPPQCEGTTSGILSELNFEFLINWLKENKFKAFLTETGAASNQHCADIIRTYLGAVNDSGVFVGWTVWSAFNNPFISRSNLYPTDDKIQFNSGIAVYLTPLTQDSKQIRLVFEGGLPSGNKYSLTVKSQDSSMSKKIVDSLDGGDVALDPVIVDGWAYSISAESLDGSSHFDCGAITSNVVLLTGCELIETDDHNIPEHTL